MKFIMQKYKNYFQLYCCFAVLLFYSSIVIFAQNTRKLALEIESQKDVSTPIYTPSGKLPEIVVQEGANIANCLKYSNDGKYIMSGTDSEVNIFERESGILVKKFLFSDSTFVDFSPDCKYIACIFHNSDIVLIEIESRKKIVIGKEKDDYSRECSFMHSGVFPLSICQHNTRMRGKIQNQQHTNSVNTPKFRTCIIRTPSKLVKLISF